MSHFKRPATIYLVVFIVLILYYRNSSNLQSNENCECDKLVENEKEIIDISQPDHLPQTWKENSNNSYEWLKYLPQNNLIGEKYKELALNAGSLSCPKNGENLELLIFVHSSPQNRDRRMIIRQTWGYYKILTKVKIYFFIGMSEDLSTEKQLEAESESHEDLIRIDILENYQNLTYKTVAMLEWVIRQCGKVNFLMKVDDDVFCHVPNILKFLKLHQFDERIIYGYRLPRNKPVRDPDNIKSFVTTTEYSGDVYPPYLIGGHYFMTSDIITDLYFTALNTPFFKFEDLFLNGFVAMQLGIRLATPSGFMLPPFDFRRPHVMHKILTYIFYRNRERMFDIWKRQFVDV